MHCAHKSRLAGSSGNSSTSTISSSSLGMRESFNNDGVNKESYRMSYIPARFNVCWKDKSEGNVAQTWEKLTSQSNQQGNICTLKHHSVVRVKQRDFWARNYQGTRPCVCSSGTTCTARTSGRCASCCCSTSRAPLSGNWRAARRTAGGSPRPLYRAQHHIRWAVWIPGIVSLQVSPTLVNRTRCCPKIVVFVLLARAAQWRDFIGRCYHFSCSAKFNSSRWMTRRFHGVWFRWFLIMFVAIPSFSLRSRVKRPGAKKGT